MTNLDSILKSRDITLPTKVHPVKARLHGSTVKSYPTSEVRGRSPEEILHVQGKRNPSKMVGTERGHQRADRLNHNHRQLANLITWTTALSNSMKLSRAVSGHQRQMGHGGEV